MAKGRVEIDEDRCKGCGLCLSVCPKGVLKFSKRLNLRGFTPVYVEESEQCTGCGMCAMICPDVCITVYRLVPLEQ